MKYPTNKASVSHDFKGRISKNNSNKSQRFHSIVSFNLCVLPYDYLVLRHHVDNATSITHLSIYLTFCPFIQLSLVGLPDTVLSLWKYFLANSFSCLCPNIRNLLLREACCDLSVLSNNLLSYLRHYILPRNTCGSHCGMGNSNFWLSLVNCFSH